jgi:hypothetical protein
MVSPLDNINAIVVSPTLTLSVTSLCHLMIAETLNWRLFEGVHRTSSLLSRVSYEPPNLFWFSPIDELAIDSRKLVGISRFAIVSLITSRFFHSTFTKQFYIEGADW